ncbi:hypothetical protein [Phytohabitans rumicis]|uniref:Uncharacterized protein n=1 Tax=Phytohabitans rumicis TaxID=1076125 RepID=A0A6V8KYV8_9ACTN|nr:hypothetical protein [Phytohabitans rumicis]GFJ86986.1 hypothetical protein Prum_006280 [Phytohabitans rumicis]
MSDDVRPVGGFAGDPGAALAVVGTAGCCGNSPQTASLVLPDPAAAGAPCCGTVAEADAAGGCCGAQAKAGAVASGAGCCG